MDDIRIGNTLRVIRVRKHLRQVDVARRAGTSRETVSRLERGWFGRVPYDTFRSVATALGIGADVRLRWQGGDLDRVLNAAHAALHEALARYLGGHAGWARQHEVSFSIYGERGVIDILAWHAETRSLLIIELKTELVDPQDLVATMGRRTRLGTRIAEQFGWAPLSVSAWVVVVDSSTNRRRCDQHTGLLRTTFPSDGRNMRRWLRAPSGTISALSFWSHDGAGSASTTTRQVRRVRARGAELPSSVSTREQCG